MSVPVGILIVSKQKRYIDLFNKMNAINEEHSIGLDEIGERRGLLFDRMIEKGVFIKCNNGKFYIDNKEAIKYKYNIRKKGLTVLLILMIIFILFHIFTK